MSLKSNLDKLADSIAAKAALSATSLQESVDALKALTQYYAVLQKRKNPDEDDESGTFADFAAQIGETEEQGHAPVRNGRGKRGTAGDGH